MKNTALSHMAGFKQGINDSVNTPAIPTGFGALDRELGGGLYEGLYVMGAISSLGKTSLALQIADQIAQAGQEVLIFSLEMSRYELMAKSISRHSFLLATSDKFPSATLATARTARQITNGKWYRGYTDIEKAVISAAVNEYEQYAQNIFMHEGIGDIGVAQIRATVQAHINLLKRKPVVLIDYVQVLAPLDVRSTDKQNTDRAMLELKRISRDFKIPIIGISSFNRENYSNKVSMSSFKESGAIEYSSDALIGLQLKGVGTPGFDPNAEKIKDPRQIELVILKNRQGKAYAKLDFEYYPQYNYFYCTGKAVGTQ